MMGSGEKGVVLKTGGRLAVFALFALGLVIFLHELTYQRINVQQQQLLEQTLGQLIPKDYYNDPLTNHCVLLKDEIYGKQTYKAYLAIDKHQQIRAIAVNTIASTGYNGDINLLFAYDLQQHNMLGLRVLQHQETPGLGDKIDLKRSNWVLGFNLIHFDPADLKFWAVKKDGGHFDQFTGATITPRAVLLAVKESLQFLQQPLDLQQLTPCQPGGKP